MYEGVPFLWIPALAHLHYCENWFESFEMSALFKQVFLRKINEENMIAYFVYSVGFLCHLTLLQYTAYSMAITIIITERHVWCRLFMGLTVNQIDTRSTTLNCCVLNLVLQSISCHRTLSTSARTVSRLVTGETLNKTGFKRRTFNVPNSMQISKTHCLRSCAPGSAHENWTFEPD